MLLGDEEGFFFGGGNDEEDSDKLATTTGEEMREIGLRERGERVGRRERRIRVFLDYIFLFFPLTGFRSLT